MAASAVMSVIALAGVATGSAHVLIPVMALHMLMLANGWVRLLRLPSPRGTTAALAGASVLVLIGGFSSRETHVSLLPAAVACALLLEFAHQLGRGDGRRRLVDSISSSVLGISVITSGACFLLLDHAAGVAASLVVVVAVLLSVGADRLRYTRLRLPGAAVAAILLGAAGGYGAWALTAPAGYQDSGMLAPLAGALAALASFSLRSALCALPAITGFRARWAAGSACVLSSGVLAYGLAWVAMGGLAPLLSAG